MTTTNGPGGNGPRGAGPGGRGAGPGRTPLQRVIYWGLVACIWGMIFIVTILFVFALGLPDTSKLLNAQRQPSISYLDQSGALLAVRGSRYAPPVDIDSLPKYVPDAFIAIEDRHFYIEPGFNPWRMVSSEFYNLTHHGRPLRGGSTITQQLARNLFLDNRQTYRRKIQELVLAIWLEIKFSKKQILALYLNREDFGSGAYGIEAASRRYFDTSADHLTLGEAALLAGMLKGPEGYSPINHTARAETRASLVLKDMVDTHKITAQERDAAFASHVHISPTAANQPAQYFVDWIDGQVQQIVGKPTEDLIVDTTLDLPIQMAAENALRAGVAVNKARGVQQGALVALNGEGSVLAYAGGVNYGDSQYDRASLCTCQPGSSFKPFVYLTAMEQGHTPYEMNVDEPTTIATANGPYQPHNFESNDYKGPISLQNALAESVNTVAVKLAQEVGTANVAATAHRLGITSPIPEGPAMALGVGSVTPLQMATAYSPFDNGGFSVQAYGIEKIRTATGRVLYDASQHRPERKQVIESPALQYMNQMLRQVMISGTGASARIPAYDLAGKTGTASDFKDAWYVGYTGGFVTAVWVGRDDSTPMKNVTGAIGGIPVWKPFMAQALPRLKVGDIPGGPAPGPPPETKGPLDAIGNMLSNLTGIGKPAAPGPAPAPQAPPTAPAAPVAPPPAAKPVAAVKPATPSEPGGVLY